jgi:hypothetical protein
MMVVVLNRWQTAIMVWNHWSNSKETMANYSGQWKHALDCKCWGFWTNGSCRWKMEKRNYHKFILNSCYPLKSGILKSQGKGFGLPWHLGVNNNLNSIAQDNKGLNTTYSSSYDLTVYANARYDQRYQGQEIVWFGSRLSYYKCMQIWQFLGKKIEKEHEVYKCEWFISLALQTWLHEQWHDNETVKLWRWLKV